MEKSPEDPITQAIVSHEFAHSQLTQEEKDILTKLDEETDIYETKNGREMSDKEWENILDSVPGSRDALERYSGLVEIFEQQSKKGSGKIN